MAKITAEHLQQELDKLPNEPELATVTTCTTIYVHTPTQADKLAELFGGWENLTNAGNAGEVRLVAVMDEDEDDYSLRHYIESKVEEFDKYESDTVFDEVVSEQELMKKYPDALKWKVPVPDMTPIPWNIWSEGYAATGESSGAVKINDEPIIATSFDEAVRLYAQTHPIGTIRPYTRNNYSTEEAWEHRRSNWQLWGCALFSNEADARKSFG